MYILTFWRRLILHVNLYAVWRLLKWIDEMWFVDCLNVVYEIFDLPKWFYEMMLFDAWMLSRRSYDCLKGFIKRCVCLNSFMRWCCVHKHFERGLMHGQTYFKRAFSLTVHVLDIWCKTLEWASITNDPCIWTNGVRPLCGYQ